MRFLAKINLRVPRFARAFSSQQPTNPPNNLNFDSSNQFQAWSSNHKLQVDCDLVLERDEFWDVGLPFDEDKSCFHHFEEEEEDEQPLIKKQRKLSHNPQNQATLLRDARRAKFNGKFIKPPAETPANLAQNLNPFQIQRPKYQVIGFVLSVLDGLFHFKSLTKISKLF